MTKRQSKLTYLLVAAGAALGTQAVLSNAASADNVSVRVGGSAHVEAGVHINVDGVIGALATLEAGLSVGIGFSAPPPPPPPPPVPSYYVEYVTPAPIYAPPQPLYIDQPMVPAPAPMSRWGLGAFAGSVHIDDQEVGSDLGLVGRYRLSRSWSLEGEVAKTKSTSGSRRSSCRGSGGLESPRWPQAQALPPTRCWLWAERIRRRRVSRRARVWRSGLWADVQAHQESSPHGGCSRWNSEHQ